LFRDLRHLRRSRREFLTTPSTEATEITGQAQTRRHGETEFLKAPRHLGHHCNFFKDYRAEVAAIRAQLKTYLGLAKCPAGLLINFNVAILKNGITRVLNTR